MTDSSASSASAAVLLDLTDGVATITLNRPEAMNSLDVATKVLLLETIRKVAEDPAARCVVLTGTGRAFCTGQDLKEHVEILQSGATDDLFLGLDIPTEHFNLRDLLGEIDLRREAQQAHLRLRRHRLAN